MKHRIDASLMIPGRGAPVKDACVILEDDRIFYAGPAKEAPELTADQTHTTEVVMPGLWDCHVHLMGLKEVNLASMLQVPLPLAAARCASDVSAALDAGFTSVREVGGLGIHLARAVDEGTLRGPRIYAAGAILSQTGGHGDVHSFSLACITDFVQRGGYLALCDGVSECMKAVRTQLRLGVDLIKVCASGGVLSERDHPMHQQFSDAELAAIVAEAERAERIVAAHCHGKAGILAALRAGALTIEHGTYLDNEAVRMMRDRGALLVPTRFMVKRLVEHGDRLGVPPWAVSKIRALEEQHRRSVELALASGVTIALGTDIVTTGADSISPWGMHGHELALLVEVGMAPLSAIEAATANGPLTLGPRAPRSGLLSEGYDADVLCVDANPLEDIQVLADPQHIVKVFKAGKLVKAPAVSANRADRR